jgi:HSP20 family protein
MANLTRRSRQMADPWRDFFDLGPWGNRGLEKSSTLPAVNIAEDDKNFIVDVAAPGFKKDDFKIHVEDDILTISAETKNEIEEGNNRNYSRREYSYSSFTRSFQLPDNAKDDQISAKYMDGILHLTIPKSEQKVKATRQINIQ